MIPFVDLREQFRRVREEALAAVAATLDAGHFVLGPQVAALESEFAAYSGAAFGVGVNNGTNALYLSLLSAGIGPGDEVITVPYTFVATVAAIVYTGARPVLVDIDPVTYTMDPASAARAITSRTRALLPVHLYGQTADMPSLLALAGQHGLTMIEDAAQAHGATDHGRRAGSMARFGCFSFYPTKNLGSCGEGGMVLAADEADAQRLRLLRDWGQSQRGQFATLGFNMRLEGVQASILRVKLRHLEEWTERRRALAAVYGRELGGLPLVCPGVRPGAGHVYHLYVIQIDKRDRVRRRLGELGVQTAVYYAVPAHLQPAYAQWSHGVGSLPVAENLAGRALALPMYAEMTDEQQERVIDALRKTCRELSL